VQQTVRPGFPVRFQLVDVADSGAYRLLKVPRAGLPGSGPL